MKRIVLVIIMVIALSAMGQNAAAYSGGISAASAILYQPDTDSVIYEYNADSRCLIASTTKILTALVVLENCSPEEIVDVLPEYTGVEGSSMYLKPGERFTVEELLYGLLLISGNDAAHALACFTAGGDGEFAELMNKKANDLGCVNSHFANPHGLDDDNHYSTARDLAKIMAEAMKNPVFAKISGTKSISFAGRTLTNHNKLLWSCDGINGGKTGYTISAGRTLVTSCCREGMGLICVTISDRNDWEDHSSLYNWGYDEFQILKINESFEVPVISGTKQSVSASANIAPVLVKKSEECAMDIVIPKFVYAPVHKGDIAGETIVTSKNGTNHRYPIKYMEDVQLDESVPLNLWEQIKWSWYYYNRHSNYVPSLPSI